MNSFKIGNPTIKPLVFKTCSGLAYFDYEEIIMFKAEGRSTLVYSTSDSPSKLFNCLKILHTISYIGDKYPNNSFYRCHRSSIINLIFLEKLEIKTSKAFLRYGINVDVSRDTLKYLRSVSEDCL
jgi:DNA-binding LytR/AlgR family response regulator